MPSNVGNLPFYAASLILAAVAFVCYLPSLEGDFVFDDSEAIVGNDDLKADVHWTDLFQHDFWGKRLASKHSHKSYRPLTVLTYRWNYWLSRDFSPWGFHFTNLLLHPVVCVVLLRVCSIIMGRIEDKELDSSWKSFVIAILFAVHPIHTESVAGIVGRADLMSALCVFLAIWAFHKCCCVDNPSRCDSEGHPVSFSFIWIIVCIALCGLAMLFKEQGITAVGICLIYDVIIICKVDILKLLKSQLFAKKESKNEKQTDPQWITGLLFRQFIMITATTVILGARFHVMGTGPPKFQPVDNPASFSNSTLTRFATYNYIYALNGWLLVNPWWLCFDWSMGCIPLIESIWDIRIISTFVFWVVMLALVRVALVSENVTHRKAVTMGLALLVLPFLPASNLFFTVGFVIAERVLYISVAGFCILITTGLSQLWQHSNTKRPCCIALILLIFIFSIRSMHRSHQWTNEIDLFTSGVSVCPLNAKVHYNIGKVLSDQGKQNDIALASYRKAVELHPTYDQAWNNLGNMLKDMGKTEEAEQCLQNALDSNPEFAAAWMNLGIVKGSLNKTDEAEKCYRTAIIHRRNYPDAYYNLGNLYIELNRFDDAVDAFRNATALKTDHLNSWTNLALLHETRERYSEAKAILQEGLENLPNHPRLIYNLANVLGKMGQYDESERYFKHVIDINPQSAEAHANLAVVYHRAGKLDLAEKSYRKSLQLDPSNALTQDNLNKLLKKKKQ